MKLREVFENWCKNEGFLSTEQDKHGAYVVPNTQDAWKAFRYCNKYIALNSKTKELLLNSDV